MTEHIAGRPTYRNLLKSTMEAASIRNALGDIGNRIGLGNGQIGANKQDPTLKPGLVSSALPRCENASKQVISQQTNVTKSTTTTTTSTRTVVETEVSKSSTTTSMVFEITSDEDNEMYESMSEDEDTEPVVDIDAGDSENPQFFSAYVRDIYSYLIQMERKYRISPHFLQSKSITSKMRAVLIDWLIQVHAKFRLLQETMYLCVYLIDAYLERRDVSKMELQLVGVTALFLACKYEEMYVPAIDDFVYMTDNTYTSAEIRAMEISMCKTLNFAFGKPLPLHFLRRFSKAGQADPKQHTLAKYFMELSLHEVEFASIDPSYLAAASLCLSFKLLDGPKWNKNMHHHSGYKQSSLELGMHKISKLVLRSSEPDYKYKAAFNKNASSKSMRISTIPELSGELIRGLAATQPLS